MSTLRVIYSCDGCGEETEKIQNFTLRIQTLHPMSGGNYFGVCADLCKECSIPFDHLVKKLIEREKVKQ